MQRHWEIAWTTLQPLSDEEIEQAVAAIATMGCYLTSFAVETAGSRYVAVRHRQDDEFLLEFGFAQDAPCCSLPHATLERGLARDGTIVWNWCCTGRRQPETGLLIRKLREVQAITGDKLLVWDDDGMCHWSWGSCPLEQTGCNPMTIVDRHLAGQPFESFQAAAS